MRSPIVAAAIDSNAPGLFGQMADSERWLWRLMLAPAILYIVLLVGFPFLLSLYYSLSRCDRCEPRNAFRRPREFPARGRKPRRSGLRSRTRSCSPLISQVLVIDIRQRPGDGAADGFPRQVGGAAADPAALGRADLAEQHRLAMDLRFHLQHHQLDAARDRTCSVRSNGRSGSATPDLAMASIITVQVWRMLPLATVIILAGFPRFPRTSTMRPRSTGPGSGGACSSSRCRSSCRSRWSRCCSGSSSPSPI